MRVRRALTHRLAQGRQFQVDVSDQFFATRSAGQTFFSFRTVWRDGLTGRERRDPAPGFLLPIGPGLHAKFAGFQQPNLLRDK
jgi:hypothetical protein